MNWRGDNIFIYRHFQGPFLTDPAKNSQSKAMDSSIRVIHQKMSFESNASVDRNLNPFSRSQLDDWKIEGDDTEANMERDARMMLYWVSGHHYILDVD